MAELDTRHIPSLGMLTAPIHAKTHPNLQPFLQNPQAFRLQEIIRQTMLYPSIAVGRVEEFPNHLHDINIIHLSNGSRLALKISPSPAAQLLRHERHMLDNEALTLQALARSNLPIPRMFKYDPTSSRLGSPFVLTTFLPGESYAKLQKSMTATERAGIEPQMRLLNAAISQYVPPATSSFGPVAMVAANRGFNTWGEAFKEMLESVLMDAEDRLVNLPYCRIRDELAKHRSVFDVVREPCLVVLGLSDPRNILIDRHTNSVTGLLDFGRALWGDWQIGATDEAAGSKGLL